MCEGRQKRRSTEYKAGVTYLTVVVNFKAKIRV